MVQSYDKLGLEQLRDDSRRVPQASFPDSYYLTTGKAKPKDRACGSSGE